MRKSVAEQLAELATPAPATDPEAADALDDGPGIFESDEELAVADTRPSKRAPEKRQRHVDIQLDSKIYSGRKASRRDIFNDGSLSASSGDDIDVPEPNPRLHRSATGPGGGPGHSMAKRTTRSRQEQSLAEIDEGEWGSDGGDGGSGSEQGTSSDDREQAADEMLKRVPSRRKPAAAAKRGHGTDAAQDDSPMDDSESEGGGGSGMDAADGGLDGRDSSDADDGEADVEGWAKLEADFATIQAPSAASKPPSATPAQASKAASVANQVKLWERALGVRITLQRGLVAADRLPRGATYGTALATADGAAAKVDAAKQEAAAVLGDCMDAMHALIARTVEGAETPEEAGAGPGAQAVARSAAPGACEGVWPLVQALEARFQGFRDEEVDRWHRRTLLASGQVAMKGAGGLQALNQPLSRQVSEVLRNPDRALARTRRRRQEHDRVLCEPAPAARATPGVVEDGGDAPEGCGADVMGATGEGGRMELDEESYDDSAFYQLLLQEFLEAAESEGRVSGVALVPKSRKVVDRRASKGRKVRYHVMPKLVNFMVPVEDKYPEADDRISALFGNLFGHQSRS